MNPSDYAFRLIAELGAADDVSAVKCIAVSAVGAALVLVEHQDGTRSAMLIPAHEGQTRRQVVDGNFVALADADANALQLLRAQIDEDFKLQVTPLH